MRFVVVVVVVGVQLGVIVCVCVCVHLSERKEMFGIDHHTRVCLCVKSIGMIFVFCIIGTHDSCFSLCQVCINPNSSSFFSCFTSCVVEFRNGWREEERDECECFLFLFFSSSLANYDGGTLRKDTGRWGGSVLLWLNTSLLCS